MRFRSRLQIELRSDIPAAKATWAGGWTLQRATRGSCNRVLIGLFSHFEKLNLNMIIIGSWNMTSSSPGTGRKLFNAFAENTSDLLCTNMSRPETNPTWAWWQHLVWPHESKPDLIGAFLPFARLSARAIDTLIAAGQDGIDGIYELVWPTVLHHHSLTIEDIGGDGPFVSPANVNRWYTSTITSETLSPGTFVFRPIRYRPERIPNKLWHPVKRGFFRHALGRLISRISSSLSAK